MTQIVNPLLNDRFRFIKVIELAKDDDLIIESAKMISVECIMVVFVN